MNLKKKIGVFVVIAIMLSFMACSFNKDIIENDVENRGNMKENNTFAESKKHPEEIEGNSSKETNADKENEEMKQMKIQVGDYSFTATLEDNSSADALMEYLADGPVTLSLEDYAGMEKVGNLGTSLPRNDEQMHISAGDIILYQGKSFVIYYGENSWILTRLGKIENISVDELKEALGMGDVDVTLSLK